jgi:plastocyanin
MRKLLLPLPVVALLLAPSLGDAAGKTVKVGDNFFSPKTMTVAKGTTITWKWVGDAPHNVKATGAARFSSGSPRTSGSYRRTLRKSGTYRVVCVVHPDMKQTVRVR